jgi:hypothetical protein
MRQSLGTAGGSYGGAGEPSPRHIVEMDLTLVELVEIQGEELALPRMETRGKKNIISNTESPRPLPSAFLAARQEFLLPAKGKGQQAPGLEDQKGATGADAHRQSRQNEHRDQHDTHPG